jgi:ATPase subunit of ABC transporter with duplicated ATPase domains
MGIVGNNGTGKSTFIKILMGLEKPDEMENRQRAVFMAGCDVLDEGLVAFASRI